MHAALDMKRTLEEEAGMPGIDLRSEEQVRGDEEDEVQCWSHAHCVGCSWRWVADSFGRRILVCRMSTWTMRWKTQGARPPSADVGATTRPPQCPRNNAAWSRSPRKTLTTNRWGRQTRKTKSKASACSMLDHRGHRRAGALSPFSARCPRHVVPTTP